MALTSVTKRQRRSPKRLSIQERIIATLYLVIGALFFIGLFMSSQPKKNVLFIWFGYASYLLPVVFLGGGILMITIRCIRDIHKAILLCVGSTLVVAHLLCSIELLASSPASGMTLGGRGGSFIYSTFRLILSHYPSVCIHVLITSIGVAVISGNYLVSVYEHCANAIVLGTKKKG